MTDIVERLRDPSKGSPRWGDTMSEAADEIERLRAERDRMREALAEWRDEPPGGISKGDVLYLSPERVAAQIETARRDEREACAAEMDCGCPEENKAAVLEALRGGFNSAKRWEACSHSQCSAIDAAAIRARGDA
jgi:hypothetical protein